MSSSSTKFRSCLKPLGLLVLVAVYSTGFIPYQANLRAALFDWYQVLSPREKVSAPVVIVDIDEESLRQQGQWPWPRSLLAQLVDKVNQMQPAAMAIDIIMPEQDRSSPCESTQYIPGIDPELTKKVCQLPSNDALLAAALRRSNVALGVAGIDTFLKQQNNETVQAAPMLTTGADPRPLMRYFPSALQNIKELSNAARGKAILSTDIEGGVVRRVPLVARVDNTVLPTLSLELLRLAVGTATFKVDSSEQGITGVGIEDLMIPTQRDGSIWVHYSHHDPSRFVSAAKILNGEISADVLKQKLVLLGFSGLGLVDFPSTAIGERVPGVEIHAQILESIFDGTTLLRPDWAVWVEATVIFLLGLLAMYGVTYIRAWVQLPLVFGVVGGLAGAGFLFFTKAHWLIDIATPMVSFVVLYGVVLVDELVREEDKIHVLEDDLRVQREEAAKVRGEMEAAKRFQMGIVPDPNEVFSQEPRLDIAALMEPAKMVGGDLYDCFMLDEDRAFFIVGDVCGKGVPASLFMVISKTLCKSVVLRDNITNLDLGGLISQANREISRDNPEMLFVTAFAGILDLRNGELVYCNAGHERPYIVSQNHKPTELMGASGPPVSVLDDYEYETFNYKLSTEEFICLFSDGVTEAFNLNEELYGQERLLERLREVDSEASAGHVLDVTCNDVRSFVGEAEPSDDLTIMIIRWQGNS